MRSLIKAGQFAFVFFAMVTILYSGGCSPVPIPYIRTVPEGVKTIYVCDVDTEELISDAMVDVMYEASQVCWPCDTSSRPIVFPSKSEFTLAEDPNGTWSGKEMEVHRTEDKGFQVKSELLLASFQPLWTPALSHTIYRDYHVMINANADGYYPLKLIYFSTCLPEDQLDSSNGGAVSCDKKGKLTVKLKRIGQWNTDLGN